MAVMAGRMAAMLKIFGRTWKSLKIGDNKTTTTTEKHESMSWAAACATKNVWKYLA